MCLNYLKHLSHLNIYEVTLKELTSNLISFEAKKLEEYLDGTCIFQKRIFFFIQSASTGVCTLANFFRFYDANATRFARSHLSQSPLSHVGGASRQVCGLLRRAEFST